MDACAATPKPVHPQIVETLRTFERSDHLFQLGRTIINPDGQSKSNPMGGIVTYAKGGQSLHNYGLALDLVMMVNGKEDWTINIKVVEIFKAHGFAWGGDWKKKDSPHFQMALGHTWQDLLKMHDNKEFITGTNYLNI